MPQRLKHRWLGKVGRAALALLWALELGGGVKAQVALGDLHASANGDIMATYGGSYGNLSQSEHLLGIGGAGTISGNYYDPRFLSFSVLPYYNRSQDNSESQSITDSSGYTGTLNLFSGSHFPGFFDIHQMWNDSGTFGIPGLAGLTTENRSRGFGVGWSELLPDKPSLSISYGQGENWSSLLGSAATTEGTNRTFSVRSGYVLDGFRLNGGFIHIHTNAGLGDLLEDGETENTSTSSNEYYATATRGIPYRGSSFTLAFNRGTYSTDDSVSGQSTGASDSLTGTVNLMFPRLPVSVVANYTDNIFGNYEQQLVSTGQAPLPGISIPTSRSASVTASTYYTILPHLNVGGYVTREEQFFAGQDYGLTQFGATINYGFARFMKGLRISAGVVDVANQQGNLQAGLIGSAFYSHSHGRSEIEAFVRYDQFTQTLLAMYTTSMVNWGGTFKYNLGQDLRWIAIANCTRSVFEQASGDENRSEGFDTMLLWRRATVSANYMESKGTAVFTATGLVQTPVPASVLSPINATLFNGTSYGGTFKVNPVHNMSISTSYEKTSGSTVSPLLLSNNGATIYNGLLQYIFRKVIFTAGATRFNQYIYPSSTAPSMLTSFSFGISRWFKAF